MVAFFGVCVCAYLHSFVRSSLNVCLLHFLERKCFYRKASVFMAVCMFYVAQKVTMIKNQTWKGFSNYKLPNCLIYDQFSLVRMFSGCIKIAGIKDFLFHL